MACAEISIPTCVPIAAGTIVLHEPVPSDGLGAVRLLAYVAVTVGAVLLATPDPKADAQPTERAASGGIRGMSFQQNRDLEGLPGGACAFTGAGAEGSDYTVLGDAVNFGARLEGANKLLDTDGLAPKGSAESARRGSSCT